MMGRRTAVFLPFALLAAMAGAQQRVETARAPDPGIARAFPYDACIVDLLVTGAAAKTLYDRLPGKGARSACGGTGLHKGDGRISCTKDGAEHVCHIWLDMPRQALTEAETDDC
ncbi:hypothetical protein BH11PSE6_BH11PSE6_08950 [soil metagenome]